MSGNTSFLPMGKTVALDTNATPATASAATILATDVGTPTLPSQVRIVNTSANIVYVSFSITARTAIAPVPGTPQIERPILPGSVEVFTIDAGAGMLSVFVNTIAAVGSSNRLLLTFGEGL